MKKTLSAAVALTLLAGCSSSKTPENTATPVSSANVSDEYKKIEKTDNISCDGMNKYMDCYYDFDGDGNDEAVTLYTSAEQNENGDFLWDDSQSWTLCVEGEDGGYVLSETHTHGKQELFASEKYEEDRSVTPAIRLIISTSSEFTIKEYAYSDGAFTEKTVYSAGDVNELSVNQY